MRGKRRFYFKIKAEGQTMQIVIRARNLEQAKELFFQDTRKGNFIVDLHISEKPFFINTLDNTNFRSDRKLVAHLKD